MGAGGEAGGKGVCPRSPGRLVGERGKQVPPHPLVKHTPQRRAGLYSDELLADMLLTKITSLPLFLSLSPLAAGRAGPSDGRKVIFKNLTTGYSSSPQNGIKKRKKTFAKTQRFPEIKKKEKTFKTLDTETLYFNIII